MGVMKTVITYKKNEKWIYDEIEKHSGKGSWIKDILSNYLKGNLVYIENAEKQVKNTIKKTNSVKNSFDLSEFGNIFDK